MKSLVAFPLLVSFLLLSVCDTVAQTIPYQSLREADVTWSKRVWRSLDLREKQNHCFYFPLQSTASRPSFMDALIAALRTGRIRAFEDEDLLQPADREKLLRQLFLQGDSVEVEYYNENGEPFYVRMPGPVDSLWFHENFCSLQMKEDWFFDRNLSTMSVRIAAIGICLFRSGKEDLGCNPVFWFSYSEARNVLAGVPVFNPDNDDYTLSFDDIFVKRMFSSNVIKESNIYDRNISSYAKGIDALLESERIKFELLSFEHDLWQY